MFDVNLDLTPTITHAHTKRKLSGNILILCSLLINPTLELQDMTKRLISLDNEIVSLLQTMTTDKLGLLVMLTESFDKKLEELIEIVDEEKNLPKARVIVMEFIKYLEENWGRRVPRCVDEANWNGEELMKRFNWTEDNMDDIFSQVGAFQNDWEVLEEIFKMVTTIPTTRRTRPTRSIYKNKPTGAILKD
jgi:hypothetical protein